MMSSSIHILMSIILTSPLTQSPMPMGMIAISVTIMMLMSMTMKLSSIMTMLTFLIYIGGLMVMFSYFLAMQPNLPIQFSLPMQSILYNSTYMTLISPAALSNHMSHELHLSTSSMMPFNKELMTSLTLILFLALIIVVNITSKEGTPMRPYK